MKNNQNVKGREFIKYVFLYTACADDSTFFLRDILPVKELINSFHFSGLKANIQKSEIAGIVSLKGVTEAVCGLKSIDLSNDTIKILGIFFSYNKKVQMQNNFITTIKKNTTSSSFLEFTHDIQNSSNIKDCLSCHDNECSKSNCGKTQKNAKKHSRPKIKHKPLSNTFETGGLKNVDI